MIVIYCRRKCGGMHDWYVNQLHSVFEYIMINPSEMYPKVFKVFYIYASKNKIVRCFNLNVIVHGFFQNVRGFCNPLNALLPFIPSSGASGIAVNNCTLSHNYKTLCSEFSYSNF